MKNSICAAMAFISLLLALSAHAQQNPSIDSVDEKPSADSAKHKHAVTVSLGEKGLQISTDSGASAKGKEDKSFQSHWLILDIGTNFIQDNTNYNAPGVKAFLNVPESRQNSRLFDLRQNKSINVNIDVWTTTFKALDRKHQKINITTGIGMQLYNFVYENAVSFTRNPSTVILDSISLKKDKLAFDYLNVPLMVTFKTKLTKKEWLIYGAGITAGYSIATWTKQESAPFGKVKVHDEFEFSNFNSCITAEFGITSIRFYGSYQLTSLYRNDMDQHPICVGIRFSGI